MVNNPSFGKKTNVRFLYEKSEIVENKKRL